LSICVLEKRLLIRIIKATVKNIESLLLLKKPKKYIERKKTRERKEWFEDVI